MSLTKRLSSYLFLALSCVAALAAVASALLHIGLVFGLAHHVTFDHMFNLHVGMFVLGAPFFMVFFGLQMLNSDSTVWKHLVRGRPRWMKISGTVLIVYMVVVFAFAAYQASGSGDATTNKQSALGFATAAWMTIYALLASTYYSMATVPTLLRRCQCNNVCPVGDRFCGGCGSDLSEAA